MSFAGVWGAFLLSYKNNFILFLGIMPISSLLLFCRARRMIFGKEGSFFIVFEEPGL